MKAGPKYSDKDDVIKMLNMRMRLVHGDECIADSEVCTGVHHLCVQIAPNAPPILTRTP